MKRPKNLKKSPTWFEKTFHLNLTLLSNFKKKWEIFSIFLAFSQCLNFTEERNCLVWLAIVDIFLSRERNKEGRRKNWFLLPEILGSSIKYVSTFFYIF